MVCAMARPYRDAAELITEPVSEGALRFVPKDAVRVLGIVYPGATEPLPIVLMPGFEYRMRRFEDPERIPGWTLERRRVGQPGDSIDD